MKIKETTYSDAIKRRLFLFGCSRSGTTLLQVILSRHPQIFSIPESHFFKFTIGFNRKHLAQLGLTTGKEKRGIKQALKFMCLENYEIPYKRSIFYKPTVKAFRELLDQLTIQANKNIWLEKSPIHINYIDIIQKYIPNVHFIHVVRNGKDVVASIVDRAHKYDFGEKQKDPAVGIKRWNSAIQISCKYLGMPSHSFVQYEALASSPHIVLEKLCNEIGVNYLPEITNPNENPAVVPDKRKHLANASKAIKISESKFHEIFDEPQQQQIISALDWEKYHLLTDSIQKELTEYHHRNYDPPIRNLSL